MAHTEMLRGALLPSEDQHLLLLTSAGAASPGTRRRAAVALAALAFVCSLAALVVALVSWSQVQGPRGEAAPASTATNASAVPAAAGRGQVDTGDTAWLLLSTMAVFLMTGGV